MLKRILAILFAGVFAAACTMSSADSTFVDPERSSNEDATGGGGSAGDPGAR